MLTRAISGHILPLSLPMATMEHDPAVAKVLCQVCRAGRHGMVVVGSIVQDAGPEEWIGVQALQVSRQDMSAGQLPCCPAELRAGAVGGDCFRRPRSQPASGAWQNALEGEA